MSVLIAIGHVLGAIIVLSTLGIGVLMLAAWETERNQKSAIQEACLALGITVDEIDNAEHHEKIIQFAAARFSSELFRNRFSDLCGWIQTGWGWLSFLVQACVLLGVIWVTITRDLSNSVYAWWVLAVWFFFWISSVLFALACKLFTGRFPGQAKQARKSLAEAVEKQRAVLANNGERA